MSEISGMDDEIREMGLRQNEISKGFPSCFKNIEKMDSINIFKPVAYEGLTDDKTEDSKSRFDVNGEEKNLFERSDVDKNDEAEIGETDEPQEKKGGSYKEVKDASDGDTHEVHHMPADIVTNLEKNDGPAIKMEKEDHRQTASCGNSREAREYRERQKELIDQGNIKDAIQMDIDDIHDKFGDKYDDAIAEMMEYVDKLEQEGKI